MTENQRHTVICTLSIGDISGDGHSETCLTYIRLQCAAAEGADQVKEIHAAHAAAKAKHPDLDPETYCRGFEDTAMPNAIMEGWRRLGVREDPKPGYKGMARLCAAFLNLGNPELRAEVIDCLFLSLQGHPRVFGMVGYGVFTF